MGFLILLVILAALLPLLGWLFWIAIVFFVARAAVRSAQQGMEQLLPGLEGMLSQLPQGGFDQLPPQRQQQLLGVLMQAHNQMNQMNALSRARYETRVGDLMGMAASAGIDWRP